MFEQLDLEEELPKSLKHACKAVRLVDCGLLKEHLSLLTPASKLRFNMLDLSGNDLQGSGEVLVEIMEAPVLEETFKV